MSRAKERSRAVLGSVRSIMEAASSAPLACRRAVYLPAGSGDPVTFRSERQPSLRVLQVAVRGLATDDLRAGASRPRPVFTAETDASKDRDQLLRTARRGRHGYVRIGRPRPVFTAETDASKTSARI